MSSNIWRLLRGPCNTESFFDRHVLRYQGLGPFQDKCVFGRCFDSGVVDEVGYLRFNRNDGGRDDICRVFVFYFVVLVVAYVSSKNEQDLSGGRRHDVLDVVVFYKGGVQFV